MTKESKGHNANQTPEHHDYHQKVISRRSRKEQVPGKKRRATLLCKGLGFGQLLPEHCCGASFPGIYSGFLWMTIVICKVWTVKAAPGRAVLIPSFCISVGSVFYKCWDIILALAHTHMLSN